MEKIKSQKQMSIFGSIQSKRPPSTDFNLSHTRKFGFQPGKAVPTLCQEVLPGDKWDYGMSALVRFMPMQSPVMHMVDVFNYSFFVPARLTMERSKFETFITGGKNGDGKDALGNTIEIPYLLINQKEDGSSSATSFNFRKLMIDGYNEAGDTPEVNSLLDFLGLGAPVGAIEGSESYTWRLNMQPVIAFWRIWNQYFRDQNIHPDYEELYPGIFESTGDITAAVYAANVTNAANPALFFDFFHLPRVCNEKDYFQSALPFAQRGNPVETPLTGNATINYRTQALVTGAATANANTLKRGTAINAPLVMIEDVTSTSRPAGIDNISSIELESGGFTINQLRLAARLQEWLEKMARGGARYIEQIKSHFGVTSSDARLQRPEFLGGGKIKVSISEVLQTSEDGSTPLANMAGHGVASGAVNSFNRFFEEHGFLISIMFLRPKPAYQEGIPRLFRNRFDKLDWAWPSFAHLGEQEVKTGEIYFKGYANDDDTFGYQSRYAEYKFIPSTVHGEFKTNLNFWHWGIIYAVEGEVTPAPTLSKEFIECRPSNRIFNVVDDNNATMYCIISNKITARRPLPYFGTPTL